MLHNLFLDDLLGLWGCVPARHIRRYLRNTDTSSDNQKLTLQALALLNGVWKRLMGTRIYDNNNPKNIVTWRAYRASRASKSLAPTLR